MENTIANWPTTLTINAWTGEKPAVSAVSAKARAWALRTPQSAVPSLLRVPPAADPADWRDPRIGWGLILLEREGLSSADLASGADAPEPIRALIKAREPAPVFRYRPASANRFTLLRNYAAGKDIAISGAPSGLAPDALPQYLLIYGSPTDIPWELQYILNATCAVGRLDLQGDALANYVHALLNDWREATCQIEQAVTWAVDFGSDDISHLMRDAIAAPIYADWQQDPTLQKTALFLDGSSKQASASALITALTQHRPALIVTTSHGQTGPLADLATMKAHLGLPVDQDFQTLSIEQLLMTWVPGGAIWYAHACCSAGCDATTMYSCIAQTQPPLCLVEPGSPIAQVLAGVASLGALTAPLPRTLLGTSRPLRAFIGHVEPTFDWTLRQPTTGQFLTERLRQVLYNHIYKPEPIGLALRHFYTVLGSLYTAYEGAFTDYSKGGDTLSAALYCQLAARDTQSMVILGDPTVMLPQLP